VNTEYNILVKEVRNGVTKTLVWDDVKTDFGRHGKILEHFII
jgi:hypothetical protein